MRDIQRDRVYSWEGDFHDWNVRSLSLREARRVIHWACDQYGLIPPSVMQHDGRALPYSQGAKISFNRKVVNPALALHESAHYICDEIFGTRLAPHCPEWMAIYLWLLEGYRIAPRTALHASAKARGIRWLPTWTVSPKRLYRRNHK
jgi:hypothetical protein